MSVEVRYDVSGDNLHPEPRTSSVPGSQNWDRLPWLGDMKWSGDLAIAFPFWRTQWNMYEQMRGYDAAADWAWHSGLIGTALRLQRCGLDNVLAGTCNVKVSRSTTTYTNPVEVIAQITQMVAPFIGMVVPGFGTLASVGLSAAAAIALGDPLEKAAIDIVAGTLPPGPVRQSFVSTADFLVNVYNGEDVKRAALHTTRDLVGTLGGPRALTAFDAGVAIASGEKVSDETLDLAREHIVQTMGFEGALAFDTGVGIAKGQKSGVIAQQLGRDFVVQAGGAQLAAFYDAGFALAQGESFQKAGFKFLMNIAKGSDLAEKALHFGEAVLRSIELDVPLKELLTKDLLKELAPLGTLARNVKLPEAVSKLLGNGDMLSNMSIPDVSAYLDVPAAVAWASQAAIKQLEDGSHVVDPEVMAILQAPSGGSTTTTLKLASASYQAASARTTSGTTAISKYAGYTLAVPNFAQPKEAVAVVNVIQQQALGGNIEAVLAAQALERGTRALARQPWIDYYNALP